MKNNKIISDGKNVISIEIKGIKQLNKTIDKNFEKAVKALQK